MSNEVAPNTDHRHYRSFYRSSVGRSIYHIGNNLDIDSNDVYVSRASNLNLSILPLTIQSTCTHINVNKNITKYIRIKFMEVRKGFYDLSVPVTANSLTETLEELYECKSFGIK